VNAFDDYFARMMPDVDAWIAEHAAEPVTGRPIVVPGDPINPFSQVSLDARKLSAVIQVPDEYLMAIGLIPDTRPKPPPPTRRQRLKRRIGTWRNLAARRAYRIIAGYWPDNGEDDW
jgi:hypothetical protein